ncbi:MAG: hypothetical protein JWL72_284 [Ilumatobacteraceae bacterium]|nr:hypothetical protein [Ilumatobacteraceae bacterium]
MLSRTRVACIAVVLISLAGCGNRNATTEALQSPGAVPAPTNANADASPASTDVATTVAAITAATETTLVSTTTAAPVPTTDDVTGGTTATSYGVDPAVSAPLIDTVPTADAPAAATIDDPLPPEVDGSDPAAAEAAIRYAYSHWILVDLDKTLRGTLVENGEQNADNLDNRLHGLRDQIEFSGFDVQSIVFTDTTQADVVFQVTWHGSPSPIFPYPLPGTAIFQNGTWRISGRSLCVLAISFGQGCNTTDPTNPVPASALQVLDIPPGYTVMNQTPGGQTNPSVPLPPDVLSVPGSISLVHGPSSSVFINAEVLSGSWKLGDDDAQIVLAAQHYGVVDGSAVSVDGRPGRGSSGPDGSTLAYIRADDVIVTLHATGLSVTQLIAIAGGLQPLPG